MSITEELATTTDSGNSKSAVPPINLLSCQPDELASWLNDHRFENNAMEVASFLLNCTAALPNAEEISAELISGGDKEESKDDTSGSDSSTSRKNLGDPITSFSSEVSCINPRGKFSLSVYNNGMTLKNQKKEEEHIAITQQSVRHVVWFRKPEDYKSLVISKSKKPIPGHMVLLCLDDGVTFRNKPLKQICFQLPSYPPHSADSTEKAHHEEDWYNGLSSALLSDASSITRVLSTMDNTSHEDYVFQAGDGASAGNTSTTTTTEGLPYVGCNRGFDNGALFPLRDGLLFFKPPLFIPRSKLASISCGRGSGQSRFVDMVVKLDDDSSDDVDQLEFTNIDRDELQGLNGYIQNVLIPAMKKDAEGGSNNAAVEDEDDEEGVAMAEVIDSSVQGSHSDESHVKCKRKSSRAASKSAREATRAHFEGLNGYDDDDSESDAESFNEDDDSDGSDDDDGSDLSNVEVEEKDDDEEAGDGEERDDSDDDDGSFDVDKSSKRARIE